MKESEPFAHEFVDLIPEELDDHTLYVSIPYATAVHKCPCGCGNEVVTPLTPTDWRLIFDGETVSLDPSIGNWSYPCQSHYWIWEGTVRWSRRWSTEKITAGRKADRRAKAAYYGGGDTLLRASAPDRGGRALGSSSPVLRLWRALIRWLSGAG